MAAPEPKKVRWYRVVVKRVYLLPDLEWPDLVDSACGRLAYTSPEAQEESVESVSTATLDPEMEALARRLVSEEDG